MDELFIDGRVLAVDWPSIDFYRGEVILTIEYEVISIKKNITAV